MTSTSQASFSQPFADRSSDTLFGRFVFQKFERFARFAFAFAIFAFPIGLVFGFFARDFISPAEQAFHVQAQSFPSPEVPGDEGK